MSGTADVLTGLLFIGLYFGAVIGGAWLLSNIFKR